MSRRLRARCVGRVVAAVDKRCGGPSQRVVRRDVGDQMYHPVRLSAAFFEQWLHTVCNHTLYRRVGREWPTVEMRTKRDFLRRNFIEDD